MDRDEILKKNREDNSSIDERFKVMQLRMGWVMGSAMVVAWAVMFVWDSLHGVDTKALGVVAMSGIAGMAFCQFYQFRTKSSLVFGSLAALAAFIWAVQHILATA